MLKVSKLVPSMPTRVKLVTSSISWPTKSNVRSKVWPVMEWTIGLGFFSLPKISSNLPLAVKAWLSGSELSFQLRFQQILRIYLSWGRAFLWAVWKRIYQFSYTNLEGYRYASVWLVSVTGFWLVSVTVLPLRGFPSTRLVFPRSSSSTSKSWYVKSIELEPVACNV